MMVGRTCEGDSGMLGGHKGMRMWWRYKEM